MRLSQRLKTDTRKLLTALAACLFLYTFVGFLLLPLLFEWLFANRLAEQLHREVTIQDVDVNPFVLSLTVQGLVIKEPDGSQTFVACEEFYSNFQLSSAFRRAPILKEIRLDGPYVHLVRESETRFNFSDLMRNEPTQSQERQEESAPFGFSLNNIQLRNGKLDFFDAPKEMHHRIVGLDIAFPFISNLPVHVDTFTRPHFSATINGTPVSIEGKTKPFADSVETVLDIHFDDVDIPHYLAYLPFEWRAKVLSGLLNVKATLSYRQYRDRRPTLSVSGDLFVRTFEVLDSEKRPLLNLPLLHASVADAEIMSKNFHLSKVFIESPEIQITRNVEGGLSIQSVIPQKEGQEEEPSPQTSSTPVALTLDEIDLRAGKLVFSDFAVDTSSGKEGPVRLGLEQLDITAKDISTVQDTKGQVAIACRLNDRAPLSLQGVLGVTPLSADGDATLEGLQLKWLQPYFTDRLEIMVISGVISASGKLSLSGATDYGLGARYSGEAALSDFRSVDKAHADDFVTWKALTLAGMDFAYNPAHVHIKEIALEDFFASIIVRPDGKTNLETVLRESEEKKENTTSKDEAEGPATPVAIKDIRLEGGRIDFLDSQISPSYSSQLGEIQGSVQGLSSTKDAPAQVRLEATLDNHAPLEIRGKLNPLEEDLFVDLQVDFRDIPLSSMTPYSGKYVGQIIEKGKLSLNLKYLIEEKKLDSENRLFLDQFTFGKRVDSPDAVNLPVGLAVALLKDRSGEIHLDLPVSGRLDDPEFQLGKVIVQMLTNLLAKAATSPFSLLGAVLPGGGEELSLLEFDHGSFQLTEPTKEKLDNIIQALYERPGLRLDIEGHVDLEHDKKAWRDYLFMRELKAGKLKELAREGDTDISLDEITIEPSEYDKYLERAYKAGEFEKPKNLFGFAKDLPVPEMETLMRDHIEVAEDDLRSLALQRAQRVKDYILRSGKIDPERVFLIETKPLAPPEKEDVKESRVNLKLK
jgi:hypothetical protein